MVKTDTKEIVVHITNTCYQGLGGTGCDGSIWMGFKIYNMSCNPYLPERLSLRKGGKYIGGRDLPWRVCLVLMHAIIKSRGSS